MIASCISVSSVATASEKTELSEKQLEYGYVLAELGKKDFKAHKYLSAAQFFLRAHKITKKPAMIYNAARCYQMIGTTKALEAASGYFNQFIFESNNTKAKEEARKHLTLVDNELDRRRQDEEKKATKQKRLKVLQAQKAKVKVVVIKTKEPFWSYNKITYGIGGAGIAVFVTSIFGLMSASSEIDKINNMDFSVPDAKATYKRRASELDTQEIYYFAAGAAGLGLVTWATIRWFTPPKKDKSWKVSLLLTPDSSGVLLSTSL